MSIGVSVVLFMVTIVSLWYYFGVVKWRQAMIDKGRLEEATTKLMYMFIAACTLFALTAPFMVSSYNDTATILIPTEFQGLAGSIRILAGNIGMIVGHLITGKVLKIDTDGIGEDTTEPMSLVYLFSFSVVLMTIYGSCFMYYYKKWSNHSLETKFRS